MEAVVCFGNSLSQEQFNQDSLRQQALAEGICLVREVPGIEVSNEFSSFCAVGVRGNQDSMAALEQHLRRSGRGSLEMDDPSNPPFRVASAGQ